MIICVARLDASLYPTLQHGWCIAERTYAFRVNNNLVKAIPINACLNIDIVSVQLNQAAFANGAKDEWICLFFQNWLTMAHLSIVSFHSSGSVMNNAMTALDTKILLSVVAGDIPTCRPPVVRFICLQFELGCMILSAVLRSPILKVVYYLELPQTSVDVTYGHVTDHSLVTCHGAANLRTLSDE